MDGVDTVSDAEIRRLERSGARTWPAATVERLGGWRLSMDRGIGRRANSVIPDSWDGAAAVEQRIAAVEERYRRSGLRPCFKMTRIAQPPGLDDILAQRGYGLEGRSLLMTVATDRASVPADPDIVLAPDPSPDWIETCWPGATDDGDDPRPQIVGRIVADKAFALAYRDGVPAAGALAVQDAERVCVTAVRTRPELRRRGAARAAIGALAGWARRRQARSLFLQVEADNAPAIALYAAAGYRPAYGYHYRKLR